MGGDFVLQSGKPGAEQLAAQRCRHQKAEQRAEELAQLESRQAGKPIRLAREFDVPGTVDNTAFFGTAARRLDGMASAEYSGDHTSSVRREPIGVVGSIAPWNYPLQMAAWKVLPAIADWIVTSFTAPNGAATIWVRWRAQA